MPVRHHTVRAWRGLSGPSLVLALLVEAALAAPTTVDVTSPGAAPGAANAAAATAPHVGHVFVVNLENKGYDETFGPGSPAPYLSQTLTSQGQLLTHYYGTAHNSLPNYIAQISGQGPNVQTQGDCQVYSDFVGAGTVAPGQAVGNGCVYPSSVKTVAGYTHPWPTAWPGLTVPVPTKGVKYWQSPCVCGFGPWPLIWAM